MGCGNAQNYDIDIFISKVSKSYDINEISPRNLFKKLKKNKTNLILFDTRSIAEYNVSHIFGAIRTQSIKEILKNIKSLNSNNSNNSYKTIEVVLYCSLGVRSSKLIIDLQKNMDAQESNYTFYNLQGGIFKWANDSLPIYRNNGKITKFVHPYNKKWSNYLKNELVHKK